MPGALHERAGADHVVHRDALGDAHRQRDRRRGRLHDRVGGERRRHEDAADVGAGGRHRVGDGVEDGHAVGVLAALAGRDAGHDVGAEGAHLLGVEAALTAGDALDEDAAGAVDEDAHDAVPGQRDDLVGGLGGADRGDDARLLEQRPALLLARPGHAHHQRLGDLQLVAGGDDPLGDLVAARDAAEDVDEDAAHLGIEQHHLERVAHLLGAGAAADVEEVGGLAALLLDQVERVHHQAGAVADDADVAVEVDVGEPAPLRLHLEGVVAGATVVAGGVRGQLLGERAVAVVGVLVDLELAVGGDELTVRGEHQRVDLARHRVE